jgi:uncharacterized membrane protein
MMSQAYVKQQSTHPLAVISLVLSILGFVPVLPVIGSIAGIVTGYIAQRNIAANLEQYRGAGLAKAGVILGWIGVALVVLAVVGFVLFLAPFTVRLAP